MATVTTEGWDLVAVAHQSLLNSTLNTLYNNGSLPRTVKYSMFGIAFDGTIGVPTVNLNPSGTEGTNSLASISFTIGGKLNVFGTEVAVSPNTTFSITSNLKYVSIVLKGGASAEQLFLDLASGLAVFKVGFNAPPPVPSWVPFLNGLIQAYFTDTYPGGLYYLGTVNLSGAPAELLPAGSVLFATQPNTGNPGANILALVANTSTGSPGILDFIADPALLPAGQDAALYLSNRCLLVNLVLPKLAKQLNVPTSTFTIEGNAHTPYKLTLNTPVSLPESYSPVLNSMTVYVNGVQQIQGDYDASAYPADWAKDILWVDVQGSLYLTPALVGKSITISATTPDASGSIHATPAGWALLFFLGLALGPLAAGVGVGIISQLHLGINMSALALQVNQANLSFAWPAQSLATINSISFPGDLVMFMTVKL